MMDRETVQAVWFLINSHALVRCLHVVAEAGVADALGDRAVSAADLAHQCGLDPDALHRMMRLLAAQGIFALEDGHYSHTAGSKLLRTDHPASLRALARMMGMPVIWNGFTQLEAVARTGKPALRWAGLVSYFSEHPAEASLFNQAMVAKSATAIPAVIDAYDFAPFGVIADIGGGRGHLLQAILRRHASASGILFDLPHVIAEVRDLASERLRFVAGDFFAGEIPAADVYVLMEVLHDWPDQEARRILAGIRRVAPPRARVLIVESLIADAPGVHPGKVLDVIMLAITGGRERTAEQYQDLLRATGFTLARTVPTASYFSILEAVTS
jgi:O-methyltransferase domain